MYVIVGIDNYGMGACGRENRYVAMFYTGDERIIPVRSLYFKGLAEVVAESVNAVCGEQIEGMIISAERVDSMSVKGMCIEDFEAFVETVKECVNKSVNRV